MQWVCMVLMTTVCVCVCVYIVYSVVSWYYFLRAESAMHLASHAEEDESISACGS